MHDTASVIVDRVVTTVAAETGRDAMELPPLYDVVDPEALAAVCDVFETGKITFQYAGHEVTVRADRTVDVATADATEHRRARATTD